MNATNKKLIDAIREAWASDRTHRVRHSFDNARGLWVDCPEEHSEVTDDEFVFAGLSYIARQAGLDVMEIAEPGARAQVESYQKAEHDVMKSVHHRIAESIREG